MRMRIRKDRFCGEHLLLGKLTAEDVEFFLSPAQITIILQLSRRRAVTLRRISVYGIGFPHQVLASALVDLSVRGIARPRRGQGGSHHVRKRPPKRAWVLTKLGKEVQSMLRSAGWALETVPQKRLV